MRFVSWFVVIGSIGWLLAYRLLPVLDAHALADIAPAAVTGTALLASSHLPGQSMQDFARAYTAAWNRHEPAAVAGFYAPDGWIAINGGAPYRGRAGVAEMAARFLHDFPDLELRFEGLETKGERVVYHWRFTGSHAQTGRRVNIEGSETWRLDGRGRIAESLGRYDADDYERQVRGAGESG